MDQGNKARRIKRNYYDKEIMKTSFAVALPCALVLSFAAGAAQAQLLPNDQRETWLENSRSQVWYNAYGECWHSYYGPPPPPAQCGPAPVAQYVPPPAPVAPPPPRVVAPPPPPPAPAVITPDPLPPRKTRG